MRCLEYTPDPLEDVLLAKSANGTQAKVTADTRVCFFIVFDCVYPAPVSTCPFCEQIGTVKEGPAEYFSSRLTNKERKKTLVDELLVADDAFRCVCVVLWAKGRAAATVHWCFSLSQRPDRSPTFFVSPRSS